MMQQRSLYSLDEIGDAARARILDLCHAWKLEGQYDQASREFIALNPLRADRSLGSFRVVCEGPKQGLIKDFATGESWSAIGFTAAHWFGGDKRRAVQWMMRFLGLEEGDPDALAKTRRAIARRKEETTSPSADDKKKRGAAHYLYTRASVSLYDESAGPNRGRLLDTPVYRYLKGRAIDLARFPGKVKALRFHPDLHHVPSCWCGGDYQAKGEHVHFPAMLAPIVSASGEFIAVHRTFLKVQPDGSVTKAPVGKDQVKLCLGRYQGGMIRLWKGVNVDPETGVATMRATMGAMAKRLAKGNGEKIELHVEEGIENALSIALEMPELTVASGVSVSNMGGIQYPPAVGRVVLWQQNDAHGSQADKDFRRVIENVRRQGLGGKVARPPAGFKDVNDWLMARMRAGAA